MKTKERTGWLTVSAVCLVLATAVPSFAGAAGQGEGKDLCLLNGERCPDKKETITELIERLKREIARGRGVYTQDELRRLEWKLEDYEYLLNLILYGPSRD
jgi:hypothetical protein